MAPFEMWDPGLISDTTGCELLMLVRWKNQEPQRGRHGDEVATMHSVGTSLSHALSYLTYRSSALMVCLAYLMLFDKAAAGILFIANAKSECV